MSSQNMDHLLTALFAQIESLGKQFDGMRKEVSAQVGDVRKDMKESEKSAGISRANMHRRMDEGAQRQADLEIAFAAMGGKVDSVASEVREMKEVTDNVVALRQQAQGAGTLGRWLLSAGGWVLAFASGAVSLYTWLTGRPPP